MTTILLINDVQINLMAYKELLNNAFPDVRIITASSGKAGIKKALTESPEVIIIDLSLNNIEGIETCKRLKAYDSLSSIPVIMITSSDLDTTIRLKALEAGALLFLTKPIDTVELMAQISSVIKFKSDTKRLMVKDKKIMDLEKLRIGELEVELKKAHKALDQSPVSVLITDIKGNIVYCNPKVSELTGYAVKELYGQNPRIFQSGETPKEVYQKMWDTILSGKEWCGEFHNKKRNGELYWERASISPIFAPDKSIINFLGVKEDITELRKMKDDMQISKEQAVESDRLKTVFLNNLNHEIRTPLNAILGFADLLKNSDSKDLEQKEFIEIIENSGHVLLKTVNELIEIANIETGQTKIIMSAINLNEEIESVYRFFKPEIEEKGIKFSCNIPLSNEQAMIISDAGKLNFILNNLVNNAIKYSRYGKIEFGYEKKGSDLEFFVKDDGVGIREEQKKIIFERFRQGDETITKEFQGIGLGLTISKAFVEMLGGKIWLESEENKGSIFYFTIPYNPGWEKELTVKNGNVIVKSKDW
ncbi:MAG: PAS domain S-box protein [Bacteroidales bacterium]|nr:PAS domain S-box protein [Bacteroidales bacterium]